MPHRRIPERDFLGVPIPEDTLRCAVGVFWWVCPISREPSFLFIERGDDFSAEAPPLHGEAPLGFIAGSLKNPDDADDPVCCLAREVAEELTLRSGPILPKITATRLLSCPMFYQVDADAAILDADKGYKAALSLVVVCKLDVSEAYAILDFMQRSAHDRGLRSELMQASKGEVCGLRAVSARGILTRLVAEEDRAGLVFSYVRIDSVIARQLARAALFISRKPLCGVQLGFLNFV